MVAIHCQRCKRFLYEMKPENLTSNHFDALCTSCQTRESELIKKAYQIESEAVEQIKRVTQQYLERVMRLRTQSLDGKNALSVEELENRKTEEN